MPWAWLVLAGSVIAGLVIAFVVVWVFGCADLESSRPNTDAAGRGNAGREGRLIA